MGAASGGKLMQEEKAEYLIGDVARMVGLSRDTLRFYEKKGIITAKKKENGYRYYSENDIYRLMYIIYHRKMNTSLEEIEGLIKGRSQGIQDHLSRRIAEEEAAIRQHRRAILRLKLVSRDIEQVERTAGKCYLRKFPSAYIMGYCEDFQKGLLQWFSLASETEGLDMTYFYNVLSYENGRLIKRGVKLLLYKDVEQELEKDACCEERRETEETECIYTAIKSKDIFPSEESIRKMVEWGRMNGLKAGKTVYANVMSSLFSEEQNMYCLELYMPLEGGEFLQSSYVY
ncbi:MerR family transcriptional regulator [Lacrimispora sp. 210928-DFI.3.58]|nr:MerR family transcriptional regulator [Lacrimispora sp. 210928-DFI.3.58]